MNDIAWNLLASRPETDAAGDHDPGTAGDSDHAETDSRSGRSDADDDDGGDADGGRGGGDDGGGPGHARGRSDGGARAWRLLRRSIAASAVAGACFDVAVRAGDLGVMASGTAMAALLAARVNTTGTTTTGNDSTVTNSTVTNSTVTSNTSTARNVTTCIGLVLAVALSVRSTAWVRALDLVGVIVCLVLVADAGLRARSLLASSVARAFLRPLRGIGTAMTIAEHGVSGGLAAARRRGGGRVGAGRLAGVARGGAIAAPVVAVLALLLVSADRVFASMFRMPALPDASPLVSHGAIAAFGGFAVLFVAAGGMARTPQDLRVPAAAVGRTEAIVVLGAVDALFAAFAVVQLLAVVRGAAYVQQTSGLTYAEYARSGFFQLLAVACLTLATIGGVRRLAGTGAYEQQVRRFGVITCLLTLVITAVAFRRLWLYEDAYGITSARIVAHAGTITVGLVIMTVLWGIARSRPERDLRGSVTSISLLICALMIVGLNVMNPSGWSARSALSRASSGGVEKLESVDADGLPTLAARLRADDLVGRDVATLASLRQWWCAPSQSSAWSGWNLGTSRARAARVVLCERVAQAMTTGAPRSALS